MTPTTCALALLSFVLAPLLSVAAPVTYTTLLSGNNEVPPNASTASGSATVVHDSFAHTLGVDVTFTGLTVQAVSAHIHAPAAPGANAGVVVPLTPFPAATSGAFLGMFDLSLASTYNPLFLNSFAGSTSAAEAALAGYLNSGTAYINIHTQLYPGGEIRGNLSSVPDAGSSAWLAAPAIALLLGAARRRHASVCRLPQ